MISGTVQLAPPTTSSGDTDADVAAVNDAQAVLIFGPLDAPYDVTFWVAGGGVTVDGLMSQGSGVFLSNSAFNLFAGGPAGTGTPPWIGDPPPTAATFPAGAEGLYVLPGDGPYTLRFGEGESLYAGAPFTTAISLVDFSEKSYWSTSGGSAQFSFIGIPV